MTVLQEVVEVRADLSGRAPAAQLPQGRDHLVHPCSLEQPPRAVEPAGALGRAPAAQLDRVGELLGGMIEVDQPQHLCRRDPSAAMRRWMRCQIQGAPSAMKSTLSAALRPIWRVRQQQGEDRLRSPERAVDDRGPRLRRSPVVADDVQDLRFLPVGMESVAPSSSWGHASCASRARPPSRETTTRFPVTRSSRPHAALCWAARARAA